MEETCARCGRQLTIHEVVRNAYHFKILKEDSILRFCNYCWCIIYEDKEEKSCHI